MSACVHVPNDCCCNTASYKPRMYGVCITALHFHSSLPVPFPRSSMVLCSTMLCTYVRRFKLNCHLVTTVPLHPVCVDARPLLIVAVNFKWLISLSQVGCTNVYSTCVFYVCCLVYEHVFRQYLEIFLFCYLFFVVPLLVSKRTVRNLRYVCTCVWNVWYEYTELILRAVNLHF